MTTQRRSMHPSGHRFAGTFLLLALMAWPMATQADSLPLARMKLIWPSAAMAFPTGRFGTPDPSTNHAGHKNGFDAGMDFGYMLNEFLAIGISGDYARFNMDFGGDTTSQLYRVTAARTSAMFGQIWLRAFLPGGYTHWRPYVVFGAGLGRPKANIVSPGHPNVAEFEYSVQTTFGLTGGLGVLIPVNRMLAIAFEPRYRSISTKGSEYDELRIYHDGTSETFTVGSDGKRLRQKSNTTWWELRAGLSLMLR